MTREQVKRLEKANAKWAVVGSKAEACAHDAPVWPPYMHDDAGELRVIPFDRRCGREGCDWCRDLAAACAAHAAHMEAAFAELYGQDSAAKRGTDTT